MAGGAVYNVDGEERSATLAPGGEVLLCAGAVGSPQILMLSGVGPEAHLADLGIPVVQHMEGVGEGLQDHPAVLVSFKSTMKQSLSNHIRLAGTSIPNPITMLNWFFRGKGALATVACEQGGFLYTRPDKAQPDLQVGQSHCSLRSICLHELGRRLLSASCAHHRTFKLVKC